VKTIKIKRLSLKNFKGIKEFSIEPKGSNCSIFGDNGTGKTTLFDSFCWLLFDKDSQGKSTFEVKTLSREGEALHGLEHEVEAVIDVDGRETKLRKVMTENWTKKRGSAQQEFTGHTTSYYADDIPVKLKDYKDAVSRIADEDMFKLLTSPTFFNEQLHWQKRREVLLQVCGDISDEDVIISDQSLAELPAILNGRKLEDHRKVIAERRKKVNEELKNIPIRISEVERNMPDINGIDKGIESGIVAATSEAIKQEQQRLLQIESGGAVAEKQVELRKIESQIQKIETEHKRDVQPKIDEQERIKRTIKGKILDADDQVSRLTKKVFDDKKTIEAHNSKREDLLAKWRTENDKNFIYEQRGGSICPVCGQSLPEEQLIAAREKAESEFKVAKSNKLEMINTEGKVIKSLRDGLEQSVVSNQEKIETAKAEKGKLSIDLEKAEAAILDLQDSLESYKDSANYPEMTIKAGEIRKEIEGLRSGQQANTKPIKERISSLEKDTFEAQNRLAIIEQSKSSKARIDQLKAQERELSAEYERLEGELYLTEQFVKSKVGLLESRINGKFKLARFKLFAEQINGGLSDICETTFQGVPYSTGLNHGSQINIGLDIIDTLSSFYGMTLPVFVDNSEAVTKLNTVNGQVIKLIVSEQDKKLRVDAGNNGHTERHAEQLALV